MDLTPLDHAYPTLPGPVPVPPPDANGGWWHPGSAGPIGRGEVARVDPTWSGQADNLVRGGAMVETSYHYPSGGIRPGNNDPDFLRRFERSEDGRCLYLPHQPARPFSAVPHEPGRG